MRNKILIFGDSITYGQRDLELGGWTNRLKLRIANDSTVASCHVFNMGISGQTTGEILERLERECEGRMLEDSNNVIILAAGINDTQITGGRPRTAAGDFRENVRQLIMHAKMKTPSVIYLGLTPVDESRTNPVWWDKTKNWNNELIAEYDDIIGEVCSSMKTRYVYVYDQIDPSGNEDGLHPSAEGHAIITDIMTEVVYEYLQTGSGPKAAAAGGIKGLFGRIFG